MKAEAAKHIRHDVGDEDSKAVIEQLGPNFVVIGSD
jgi:hypothetical protein